MKILLIGAGQIGSRHLQGLSFLPQNAKIFVIDPSENSLQMARQRYLDISADRPTPAVRYDTDLDSLRSESPFDVAIVATDARLRKAITTQLLNTLEVKNLILEKVLFQKKSDYAEIQKLLSEKNVKAWVNCPMRIWPGYTKLKQLLQSNDSLQPNFKMTLSGGGWGLACNSIHYIDLFSFLTGLTPRSVSTEGLDEDIIPSKRAGYFELTGDLRVQFANSSWLHITCQRDSTKPVQINLETDNQRHLIREDLKICISSTQSGGWEMEKWDLQMPYQSQLTGQVVQEILEKQQTALPTYQESVQIHLPMMEAFAQFFARKMKLEENGEQVCPIT